MPDQFGNPTVQDVMAQFADKAAADRRAARTPQERRAADLFNLGSAMSMGMNPQVVRAREIESALKRGASLTRYDGESQIDFEIRQGRTMFEDVKEVDPTTAAKITEQLTQLEGERAERSRLQERHDFFTQEAELDIASKTGQNILEGRGYVVNVLSGEQIGSVPFDAEDYDAQVQGMGLGQPGVVVMPYDLAADFGVDDLITDMYNKSDLAKMREHLDASTGMATTGTELVNVLNAAYDEETNSLSDVASAERFLNRIAANVDELEDRYGSLEGPTEGQARKWLASPEMRERASLRNISSSLLTKMAYQLALAFNRRVTDKDFELAWSMLGGDSGSPEVAINTIRANLRTHRRSVDDSIGIELANENFAGSPQGSLVNDKYQRYIMRDDEFLNSANAFIDKIQGTRVDGTSPLGGGGSSSSSGGSGFTFVPQE